MDEGSISQNSIGVPWNEQDEKTGTQAEEASLHLRNVHELGKGVDPTRHNLPAERISKNPADEVAQNQTLLQGSDRVQKELSHELMKDGGSQDIGGSVNACYPFQSPTSSCFEISKLCSNEEDSVAFGSLASTSSDKREAAKAFHSGNFIENSDYRCSLMHLCEIDGNPNVGNISELTSKSSCVADDENDSALCCRVNISKDEDRGDSLSTGIMKCTTEKIDSSRDQCCRDFNEDANGEDCTINGNVAISGSVRGNKSRGADEGYVPAAATSDLPDSLCVTHMGLQTNKMEKGIKNDHVHVDPLGTQTHANDNPLSPSMDNLVSSERQDHGYTDYKNSHSSLDSAAGTEFQHSNRYKFMEDEETRTDREDPVGNVTSTQSVVQQRKKINIHHQFVREIVKIQHDREIYDREQAERQAHVQQVAGSPQVGDKVSHIKAKSQQIGIFSQPGFNSSYNKEKQKSPNESRDIGHEANKQKGVKTNLVYRQVRDSEQRYSRNKKSPHIESKHVSLHDWTSLDSNEPNQHSVSPSINAKEEKTAPGKQQRPTPIHHSLGAWDPTAHEQRNLREVDSVYYQSGTHANKYSPCSSTGSFSESQDATGISPVTKEGPLKVSASPRESYAGRLTETSSSGGNIKVTFDTQKMQRHIQFSNGPYSSRTPEQVSFSSPHSASVSKPNRSSNVVPSSSHLSKDTRTLSGDYLLGHGEMASKDHDCQSTHSAGSGSWQSHSSAEHSKYPGRSGKASDKAREKKHSFSKQANNNANMNVSSSWVQKSSTPIHQGTDSKMGRRPFNDAPIHQGTDSKMGRRPFNDAPRQPEWLSTTPSQEFCRPSPQRTSSMVPPNKEGSNSLEAANISSEGSSRTMMNIQHNYQQQQLKSPRQYESRGNQMSALSTDSSRGGRNLHEKSNLKDSGSPFQAMVKDALKEQAGMKDANRVFPPPQRSAGAYRDSNKGNEMGWHAKEQPQAHGQESQIFSRFDVSSKDRAQNVQAQSTASPLHGGLFPYTPMQGKWGDIVDDPVEPYDYLQIRRESEKGAHFSQPYAGSEQGNSAVPEAKASRTVYQDPGHDRRMISNYGTNNLQKHAGLVRDQPTSEMSARKSVFERLGPKNNFQDSILGPPPKMRDSRGVLIASPDGAASSALPGASYKNFNAGFQDSQRPFQTPSAWCENPDNSREVGKEVVVQAYTEPKKRRGKRELYVPRGGS